MMLNQKIDESIEIIRDVLARAKNPFVIFTGDKDSLITLHLVRRAYSSPVNVLFIDTSVHFHEIYLFIEKMRRLWGFNLVKEENEEALKAIKIAEDKAECCLHLKSHVLKNSMKKYNIDYLFTGIRRDKEEARRNEDYILREEDYMRVNPIIHFSEEEVWEYIERNNLPYCSLYDKGYRIIDCIPCTNPAEGPDERSGESQQKELMIDKLRSLGYF
jgi:phosphoadenosine phosphosulfate reductase